jgi:hypothetical protein
VSSLAHPEQKLAVVRRELLLQFVVSCAVAKMDARARGPKVLPFLAQQFFPGRRVDEAPSITTEQVLAPRGSPSAPWSAVAMLWIAARTRRLFAPQA